jgi:hypothetical protein
VKWLERKAQSSGNHTFSSECRDFCPQHAGMVPVQRFRPETSQRNIHMHPSGDQAHTKRRETAQTMITSRHVQAMAICDRIVNVAEHDACADG